MYLGAESLTLLNAFISGYIAKEHELDKDYKTTFFGFDEFVQKWFEMASNHGWFRTLIFFSGGERDALNLFYRMLDEYKATIYPL